jgi:hypothetical protein
MPRNILGKATAMLEDRFSLSHKSKSKSKSGDKPKGTIRETFTYPKDKVNAYNNHCLNPILSFDHVLSCGHQIMTTLPDEPCAPNCHHVKEGDDDFLDRSSRSREAYRMKNGKHVIGTEFHCDACVEEKIEAAIPSDYDATEAEDYRHILRVEARREEAKDYRGNTRKCYIACKNSSVPCHKDGRLLSRYVPTKNHHPLDTVLPRVGWNIFECFDAVEDKETTGETTDVTDEATEMAPPENGEIEMTAASTYPTPITEHARRNTPHRTSGLNRPNSIPPTSIQAATIPNNPKKRKVVDEELISLDLPRKKKAGSNLGPTLPTTISKEKSTKFKSSRAPVLRKVNTNIKSPLPAQIPKLRESIDDDIAAFEQISEWEERKPAIVQSLRKKKSTAAKTSLTTPTSTPKENSNDGPSTRAQSANKRKCTEIEPSLPTPPSKKRKSTGVERSPPAKASNKKINISDKSVPLTRSAAKKQKTTHVELSPLPPFLKLKKPRQRKTKTSGVKAENAKVGKTTKRELVATITRKTRSSSKQT